jgi:hypothetical protein
MEITAIELQSADRTVLTVSTSKVSTTDKYLMRGVFGLDADELVPQYYGSGAVSGTKWHEFSRPPREVPLRVVLNPNYLVKESYSNIRDELYRAISANRGGSLDLVFMNGGAIVSKLTGFIIKFEVPYSTETPELQLTMKFKDPILRGASHIELLTADISTSNPVVVPDSESTAPHGFQFGLTFTATSASITIADKASDPDASFVVTPDGGFLSGDKLYFSSEKNNKQLYIDRSSTIIPLMDHIEANSVWPIMFPYINEFYVTSPGTFTWDYIKYRKAFWGL